MILAWATAPGWASGLSYGLGDGSDGSLVVAAPGTVINVATPLAARAEAGDTVVQVASSAGFGANDLVIVWNAVDPALALVPGDPNPLDVDLTGDAGRLEWARITAINGNELALDLPLAGAAGAPGAQVVRVPEYVDVTVPAGTSIAALPWDGSAGGIVALVAQGSVLLFGEISASGAGLRGGAPGRRGEALDGAPPDLGTDALGSGGGGGGVGVAGGGGGGGPDPATFSDEGDGGTGGFSVDGADAGGRGGLRTVHDAWYGRRLLGGGGGGGDGGGAGGPGGGVVIVRTDVLDGSGRLAAAGAPGQGTPFSGGGGGGGGTIEVGTLGLIDCGEVIAHGGAGGAAGLGFGPGGGGGGGTFVFVGQGLVAGCFLTATIAPPGTWPDGTTWGATDGSWGTATSGAVFVTDADSDQSYLELGDCDDADPAVNPEEVEVPGDGKDNDCDGVSTCWSDADQDLAGEWPPIPSPDAGCDAPGEAPLLDDACPGHDDRLDADADGWPDACDPTPDGEPPTDTSPPDFPGDTAPPDFPEPEPEPVDDAPAPVTEAEAPRSCGCATGPARLPLAALALAAFVRRRAARR